MIVGAGSELPEGGKARRVYLLLRDEIARGVHADGTLLPGEQRLAEIHGVSRVTVRRALDALLNDGVIERRAGSGTKVRHTAEANQKITADLATLMPQLVEMGRTTMARLLSFSYDEPPETVRDAMRLAPGSRVQIATRIRLSSDTPFSHLTTYVPEDIASNYSEADLASTPLFELLERSGVRIEAAQQSVTATLAAPDVAQALNVSVGSALLSLDRVVLDETGRGVEYLSALYRPDMFRLDMALTRVDQGGSRSWEPRIVASGDRP